MNQVNAYRLEHAFETVMQYNELDQCKDRFRRQEKEMQLLFILCESGVEDKLIAMLIEIGVPGYSRFANSTGYGKNGKREGSPIWPGLNTLLIVGVPQEMTPKVLDAVNKLEEQRNGRLAVKIFAVPAEEYC